MRPYLIMRTHLLYFFRGVFMKKRNLAAMIILMLITCGLYIIYWFVATKTELNARGAKIPTVWLFIVPLGNLYFLYRYAEAFAAEVLDDKEPVTTLLYFALLTLFMPIGIIICQDRINVKISEKQF